jgi:murein DD-endopeptidase MepM/ murein hydrolase activator NlpD
VDVMRGQTLRRGERIGAVGATGRATGPHLCWRLKWRGRNMDPMLMVGAQTPA